MLFGLCSCMQPMPKFWYTYVIMYCIFMKIVEPWCGRRKDEYIISRKFEMSESLSYFSRFAIKSPSKISVLFSKVFLKGLVGSHY